jgi:hypothetical protein
MIASTVPVESTDKRVTSANGSAMAAFLGAGIGSFAMGVLGLLDEAGIFAAPALFTPAGGVSGRTTLATVVWLVAWGLLHYRWKGREIVTGGVSELTLILLGLGILATFQPVWGLF